MGSVAVHDGLPTTFTYHKVNNLNVQLDVYTPVQAAGPGKLCPALIYFHGGGLVAFNRKFIPPYLLEAPLERGWAVVSVDYRLLPQAKGEDILEDITAAWDFIAKVLPSKFPDISLDPTRLIAAGSSAGGYLAYLAGAHLKPRPRAVLSIYGISTFEDSWFRGGVQVNRYPLQQSMIQEFLDSPLSTGETLPEDVPSKHRGPSDSVDLGGLDEERTSFGRPSTYDYFLQTGYFSCEMGQTPALNPLLYMDSSYPPTVILHGTKDRLVPIHFSELAVKTLKLAGVKVLLTAVEGADHGFEHYAHNYDTQQKTWTRYLEPAFEVLENLIKSQA